MKATVLVGAAAAIQVFVGLLTSKGSFYMFAAAGVVVLAPLAVLSPMSAAALAFPGSIATWRLGVGGLDLSYADAVLVAATVLCLPKAAWKSDMFKRLAVVAGLYLTVLAIPLAVNPTLKALLEWLHRVHFLFGALIVGSAVAKAGKARLALRLFVVAALAVSVAAVAFTLTHSFEPAYPFGIQKNPAGFLVTGGLIICIVAASVIELPRPINLATQIVLLLGVLSCQSRGSATTFIVVLFVNALRAKKKSLLVPALGALALAGMIWTSTSKQLEQDAATAQFNPIETRETTYAQALDLWRDKPVFGQGLRYWNDQELQRANGYGISEPHNLVISALGETGLVGATDVLALNGALVLGLRKRRDPIGQAAFFLVVARFVAGLADIYWVAGAGTLPWLIVGLAATSSERAQPPSESSPDGSVPPSGLPPERALQ